MNRRCLVFLLGIGVILGLGRPAPAGEIDPRTRSMLDTIFAGYRSNRAKITDLTMTGSSHKIHKQGEMEFEEDLAYKYYELGEKKRLDTTFPEDIPDAHMAGRTQSLVYAGDCTLAYGGWTGPGVIMASVRAPGSFGATSRSTVLDNAMISGRWDSHAGLIELLCNVTPWGPKVRDIRVDTITEDGEVFLQVTFNKYPTEAEKSIGQSVWKFAPERGYEVVEATMSSFRSEGDPSRKTHAVYDVCEVSPGVWRSVGARQIIDEWPDDDRRLHIHVEKEFKHETAAANTGSVQDDFFTFKGIGLPEGAYVRDFTVNPPVKYQYAGPPLTDYEYLLDKAVLLADTGSLDWAETAPSSTTEEPEEGPTTEEATIEEADEETIAEQDVNSADRPVVSTPAQIDRGGKGTFYWVVLALALSVLLGYVSRGSKVFSFLKKDGPKIVLFLLLVLIVAGQAGAIETKEHDDPLLVNKELDLYRTEENICGPTSLYHVLKEIGYAPSFDDILTNVPIRLKGCSIADMCRYLEKVGVDHQVVKCESVEPILTALRPKETAAIVHTNNEGHFITVKKTSDGRLVVLDGTNVLNNAVLDGLEQRYSGKAIIVGMGRWKIMASFMDWKRVGLMILIIPIGFGIGALVRILVQGIGLRSPVSSTQKHLVKQ